LGIGDWGLGIGPNPQSPIPNPLILENYNTKNNLTKIQKIILKLNLNFQNYLILT
jgi:hypothetical protein